MTIGCAVMIQQGASFEDFVKHSCAVVGASRALRGELPAVAAPGDRPPSAELVALKAELAAMEAMTDDEVRQACEANFSAAQAAWAARKAKRETLRDQFLAVLGKLHAWPAPAHALDVKEALIQEVEEAVRTFAHVRDLPPIMQTVTEWRIENVAAKRDAIKHREMWSHREWWAKDIEISLSFCREPNPQDH